MARNILAKMAGIFDGHKAAASDLAASIEDLRAKLRELKAAKNVTLNAPADEAEVRSRVGRALDNHVANARSFWPEGTLSSPNYDSSIHTLGGSAMKMDQLGALCLMGFRDQIQEAFVSGELVATEGKSVTAAEREAALASIDAEYHATEIMIEKLIRVGEDAGVTIERDEDARPEVYLAMEL